jgi:hypothetical protein
MGNSSGDENGRDSMKYWEIIADKLHAAGWSWGYCSAVTRLAMLEWMRLRAIWRRRLRRPQFREISIKLMVDSAAFAAVYTRNGCAVLPYTTKQRSNLIKR